MSLGGWLEHELFERRIVRVTGRLDDGAASRAAAALLALDANGAQPIELHLSSPDGELGATLTLIDTADTLRAPMRLLCAGQVGTAAVLSIGRVHQLVCRSGELNMSWRSAFWRRPR